uniref:Alpha/beta hydrolase n=1 Tax=Steinernema glaseri TaxID=37863 RepID=A0A1I8AKC3_9BILA
MTAERGDVVRDEDVAEIQQLASGVQHVRVPNAGHMIPWDNEAGFYEAFEVPRQCRSLSQGETRWQLVIINLSRHGKKCCACPSWKRVKP